MDLVLGIDLGTSYFKLGLFDREGNLCGLERIYIEKDAGDGSCCELPVDRFWSLLRQGVSRARAQAQARPDDIQAVSYSSQANSFLLLDENDQPITPLILWPDRRVEKVDSAVQELWRRGDFLNTTGIGMEISAECSVAKYRWFQERESSLWSRVQRIMTVSDYLTFSLTHQTVGDMGTASLLGLFDLQNLQWWDEALEILGLSRSQLSMPLEPGAVAGELTNDGAQRLDLSPGIPFAVGSLDHHVAAIGAGVGQTAEFSESTGTVLACLHYSKEYHPRKDCCMGPGLCGYKTYQLAFNDNGAGLLEWYQQRHAPDLSIEEMVQLAAPVDIGSDGLIALPMANRYDDLKGFQHVSSSHEHGHFVRALLESTAASLAMLADTLCDDHRPERIVATGGGARCDLWLQMKADLLGTEFITMQCDEPACMGAAIFAAVAAGWFRNTEDAATAWVCIKKTFKPEMNRHKVYTHWFKSYVNQL